MSRIRDLCEGIEEVLVKFLKPKYLWLKERIYEAADHLNEFLNDVVEGKNR